MREMEIAGLAAADGLVGPARAAPGDGPKHANLHAECLNCGTALHGRYCSLCGQADDDHHRSIFHLVWEAVEGLTHLDGRLMRTLPPLFLRPGQLARDHFEGRRQRHVPPFRLFLITLLIFMFCLELRTHHAGHKEASAIPGVAITTDKDPKPAPSQPQNPAVPASPAPPTSAEYAAGHVLGSAIRQTVRSQVGQGSQGPVEVAHTPTSSTVKVAGGLITINSGDAKPPTADDAQHGFDEMAKSKNPFMRWASEHGRRAVAQKEYFKALMFEWGHRLAILMLPIFAGMLTLCYFYKRQFYVYDHLVVAMHFLSFTFLIWAVAYLTPSPVGPILFLIATIWTPVNLFMTLRGAYGSSIVGAGLKTILLWTVALTLFLTLLLGVIFIAMGSL